MMIRLLAVRPEGLRRTAAARSANLGIPLGAWSPPDGGRSSHAGGTNMALVNIVAGDQADAAGGARSW